jgi:hypothetical protein
MQINTLSSLLVIQDNSKLLDQYYTNPEYAKSFYNTILSNVNVNDYDIILEPSAGTGNFYNLFDTTKRIGLDLDPKSNNIIKVNFFDWVWPKDKKILTIGNPPFGKNAAMAVKFFNQAAKFSDAIAFVIPRTFRKTSIINRLDSNFHKIYDETVPDNSFIFNDQPYNVWCCSQIWTKQDVKRNPIKTIKLDQISDWFKIVDPASSDFAIQRVGGRAGLIRTVDYKNYSKESHYFLKAYDIKVLPIFKKINFDEVKYNTAGNPSISPSELIELFLKEAAKQNVIINI